MISKTESKPEDNRKVAVYARKSKITETGKSIDNQISKCKSYAVLKFDAHDEDIIVYKDEGLSGFYSDRPEYMQLLQDIKDNKIKAVICYKFDRISRRTLDLLNLVEQLRQKKISFVSCTDEVDTSSKTGKIIMSLLASIAEFERDIIAERISDNMYELAKEGRWLGGTAPTGFVSKKEYISIGSKKTSLNHLEPVPEEQAIVREIFMRFLESRSVQNVVNWAYQKKILTKNRKNHTRISIRNILTNPVYAAADKDTYAYLSAFKVPIYAKEADFNGKCGLMVYNKTLQVKEIKDESTIIHPSYTQKIQRRSIEDWIIAIGRHKGIISGREWILAQNILEENKDKYIRPNEKTHSLLSGLIACPYCGRNLLTHRETGRYTNGKPRFLYKCQTKRRDNTACSCKDIKGNAIDQFVLDTICSVCSHTDNEYYSSLLESSSMHQSITANLDSKINSLEKLTDKCCIEMENLTKSLRNAAEKAEKYILEDIERLADSIEQYKSEKEELLAERKTHIEDTDVLKKTGELIFSFPILVEKLSHIEKSELIRKIVEKIFIIPNAGGDDEVHIFIKGTSEEEYQDFFQMVSERSDLCVTGKNSIFYAPGSISCKTCTFIHIKG
ncbi:site-specific DNA recombinase [Ruminiclostridium sufflavum DSM 19573]|uniref:Site-specific DNA recombinase n=1 Tax=Ruminiclostridium sufflavum DSM 19573 TaxID=1121337 RepID=A0A318XP43_9FIRM|nr:site-specific DNA recombinase [Ruminiclostridium sufflavum DSM 19573]